MLVDINDWFICNKLTVNFDKTNYMIFKPTKVMNEYIQAMNLSLNISGHKLNRVTTTKYLGIIIDDKLNWSCHVDNLITKINSLNGILYRRKYVIPKQCRRNIYFALAYSSIVYGIEIYGNTTMAILKPLITKCNNLLRTLQDKSRRCDTYNLYSEYNTLPINLLYKLFILKLMHTYTFDRSSLPTAIRDMFLSNHDVHSHNTRLRHAPHIMSAFSSSSVSFIGPSFWSKLNKDIRECINQKYFIKMCKCYLMSNELT